MSDVSDPESLKDKKKLLKDDKRRLRKWKSWTNLLILLLAMVILVGCLIVVGFAPSMDSALDGELP